MRFGVDPIPTNEGADAFAVVEAVRGLSLHALLVVLSRVLAREGYGDVRLLGRREARGRSPGIGHEIACDGSLGGLPASVIVKVLRGAGRVRHLDELAGVALRRGADAALLVAPFGLSRSAEGARGGYAPRRIEVMDGAGLARAMARHGVGVLPDGSPDRAFLASLEEASRRLLGFLREERAEDGRARKGARGRVQRRSR